MQQQRLQRHEPLGLLIAAARSRIKQTAGELARPFRLSPQQFWVLVGIAEREGSSLGQLAARHHVDQPTASRVVTALVGRGLVAASGDPEDRRRFCLMLTPPGRRLAERLAPLAAKVRAAMVAGLSTAEQELLDASLRRIVANLERFAVNERRLNADGKEKKR
jgi:DNA-binding MarR family transcriptional regulator